MNNKMLSQSIADTILSMIIIERRFKAGDKLPNENELSAELNVSRTTLREAIRILVAYNILEIQRGKGTFVTQAALEQEPDLGQLSDIKVNAKDLYEMRLIFEPEAAYLAAIRGTDAEIKRILEFGERIEQEIKAGKDRTDNEHSFHKAIAQATHNEFMNQLMPILYQAIAKGSPSILGLSNSISTSIAFLIISLIWSISPFLNTFPVTAIGVLSSLYSSFSSGNFFFRSANISFCVASSLIFTTTLFFLV